MNYFKQSRFLEDQNKKLADDLRDLRSNWGKETKSIREKHDKPLKELRKDLEESENENAELQVKIESLENYLVYLRERYFILSSQLNLHTETKFSPLYSQDGPNLSIRVNSNKQ